MAVDRVEPVVDRYTWRTTQVGFNPSKTHEESGTYECVHWEMTLPKKMPKNIAVDGFQLARPRAIRLSRSLGLVMLSTLALMALIAAPAAANENKNFSIGLSGLIGGPFDADSPDPGLDNTGFSAHFAWRTQPQTKIVARIAKVDLEGDTLGTFADPEISYINVGGEYTFREPYYTSGFYIGLGLYQLEGLPLVNTASPGIAALGTEDETTVGVALGVTADFSIVESVSLFADLSFHYADLDQASFLGFLHFGIAYHF